MIETHTLTTADADRWRAVLPADVSVVGSLEYVRICERDTGWPGRLFVLEQNGVPVAAYPYFVRSAKTLPFSINGACTEWSDTCTTEYRGPMWLNEGLSQNGEAPKFADVFARHCREHRIIAEFAHLSPWVSVELLQSECIQANREIVYVDLTRTEEEIWTRSLSSDARRQTKQGQRAGVSVRRGVSIDDVREFHRLYIQTMERRDALDRYFYPLEYFTAFLETMPANAFFVLAEYEGRVVAGGLFLHDCTELYWHLSAADREYAHVRPVNVYLYEAIRQGLGQSWKRMIMGGGYGKDDGVFRFKANFSPLRARFCTYRRVHDADVYAALTHGWSACHGEVPPADGFFPAYRAIPSRANPDFTAAAPQIPPAIVPQPLVSQKS